MSDFDDWHPTYICDKISLGYSSSDILATVPAEVEEPNVYQQVLDQAMKMSDMIEVYKYWKNTDREL